MKYHQVLRYVLKDFEKTKDVVMTYKARVSLVPKQTYLFYKILKSILKLNLKKNMDGTVCSKRVARGLVCKSQDFYVAPPSSLRLVDFFLNKQNSQTNKNGVLWTDGWMERQTDGRMGE